MAEGFARQYFGNSLEIYSAGIIATGIYPEVKVVMDEMGVDISSQRSKTIESLPNIQFDFVFTLCNNANQTCPTYFSKNPIVHKSFDDPPMITQGLSEEKKLNIYRRVRDEIKIYIKDIEKIIKKGEK